MAWFSCTRRWINHIGISNQGLVSKTSVDPESRALSLHLTRSGNTPSVKEIRGLKPFKGFGFVKHLGTSSTNNWWMVFVLFSRSFWCWSTMHFWKVAIRGVTFSLCRPLEENITFTFFFLVLKKRKMRIFNLKFAAKTIISIIVTICLNSEREEKVFEH